MFPLVSIMCETIFVVLNENSISVSKYVYYCPMVFFRQILRVHQEIYVVRFDN